MSKHTPGIVERLRGWDDCKRLEPCVVADFVDDTKDAANAIEDLLAACRLVLQGLELSGAYGTHWAVTLRTAIAKAEGGAA